METPPPLRTWVRPGIWLAGLGIVVVLAPRPAAATSCIAPPLAMAARQAAAIFEATVNDITVHPRPETRHPDGTVSFVADSRATTVALTDVRAIRGTAPSTMQSVEHALVAGRRYLIVAIAHPKRPGVLMAGACAGHIRPAVRSDGFLSWLDSLDDPPSGGRILGAVVQPDLGDDQSTWPGVAGARVVARGPITVDAMTADDGQFAIGGLPDGA